MTTRIGSDDGCEGPSSQDGPGLFRPKELRVDATSTKCNGVRSNPSDDIMETARRPRRSSRSSADRVLQKNDPGLLVHAFLAQC